MRGLVGAVAVWALAAACGGSGSKKPAPLPPQAVSRNQPAPTPVPPPPVATPAPPTTVVLDSGEPEATTGRSLAEAAQREKQRRLEVEKPVAVITNKNLADFAKGQKLTVASETSAASGSAAESAAAAAERDEKYWRGRGLEIRRRWRDAVADVERLEGESARLRRQFYSTDDPYVRDNQVKPEWDRVLAELDGARQAVASAPGELDAFLEEGRRAGALPGWLREGVELEPESTPAPPDGGADPQEPQVVDQGPGNP